MKQVPVKIEKKDGKFGYGYGEGIWLVISFQDVDTESFKNVLERIEGEGGSICHISPYEIISIFPYSKGLEPIENTVWDMGDREMNKAIWKAGISGGDFGFAILNYREGTYGSIYGKGINETRRVIREENNYTVLINRELKIKDRKLDFEKLEWSQFHGAKGNYRLLAVTKYDMEDVGILLKWGEPVFISPGTLFPFIWIKIETHEKDMLRYCFEKKLSGGCLNVNIPELKMFMLSGEDMRIMNNLLMDLPDEHFIFSDEEIEGTISEAWKDIKRNGKVVLIKKITLNTELLNILSIFPHGVPVDILKKKFGEKLRMGTEVEFSEDKNFVKIKKTITVEERERKKIIKEILYMLLEHNEILMKWIEYYADEKNWKGINSIVSEMIEVINEERNYDYGITLLNGILKSLEKREEAKESKVKVRFERGMFLKECGKYDAAEEDFRYVIWATAGTGMEELKIKGMLGLSHVFFLAGRLDDAEKWVVESLEKSRDMDFHEGIIDGEILLAKVYVSKGLYDRALSAITSLEKEVSEHSNPAKYIELLNLKSTIYIKQKKYKLARDTLLDAVNVSINSGFEKEEMAQYINLGNIHLEQGDLDEANHYFSLSLEKAKKIKDTKGIVISLYNLAVVNIEKGAYDIADNYLREGFELCINDRYQKILFLRTLGDLEVYRHQPTHAEPYIREALNLAKDFGNREMEADIYLRYGYILEELLNLDESVKYLKKALKIFKDLKKEDRINGIELNLISAKKWKQPLNKSLKELQRLERRHIEREIDNLDAEISLYMGNLKKIEEFFKNYPQNSTSKISILFYIHSGNIDKLLDFLPDFLENEGSIRNIVEVLIQVLEFGLNHTSIIPVKEISAKIESIKDYIPPDIMMLMNSLIEFYSGKQKDVVELKTEDNFLSLISFILNTRVYMEKREYEKATTYGRKALNLTEKNQIKIYEWKIYALLNQIILKRVLAREVFPDAVDEAKSYESKARSIIEEILKGVKKETEETFKKEVKLWGL